MAIETIQQNMAESEFFVNPSGDRSNDQHQGSPRISSSTFTRLRHWELPTSPTSESVAPLRPSTMPMMVQVPNFSVAQSYSPYSPVIVSNALASPTSPYAASPGSSTYSSSPMESPQHPNPHTPEEFLRYGLRQSMHRHAVESHRNQPYSYAEYPGRRRRRDAELSPEEYEKRRLRRERNKLAAWRCRTRRRERIEALEQETAQIEEQNSLVENEISNLKEQLSDLQKSFQDHNCRRQLSDSSSKVSDVKTKK